MRPPPRIAALAKAGVPATAKREIPAEALNPCIRQYN